MASIGKLKEKARKLEQKEDWQSAVEAYRQVLEKEEESDELEVELSLYNRIGDLHLRLGQTHEAVSYYETAADKYAESGFFNNAIALCNKALRHEPGRPQIYLKLSGLCAEQGFQTDARRWILEYSERQMKAGRVEEALSGLENFADLSDDPGVRETLAQQLLSHERPEEAIGQLRHAYRLRLARGEADAAAAVLEQAQSIDPAIDMSAEAEAATEEVGPGAGSTAADLDDGDWNAPLRRQEPEPAAEDAGAAEEPLAAGGIEGLETRPEEPAEVELDALDGLEGLEPTAVDASGEEETEDLSGLEAESDMLGGLETFDAGAPADESEAELDFEPEAELDFELEDDFADEESEPLPLLDTGYDELEDELDTEEEDEPLPLLDTGFDTEPQAEETETTAEEPSPEPVAAEEDAMDLDLNSFDLGMGSPADTAAGPEEDPEESDETSDDVDVGTILQRSRDLVSRGFYDGALRELQVLSGTGHDAEIFGDALSIVNEIIREDANHITALQRRVEYSALTGDRSLLVDAYLDMADALARLGAEAKAQAMYERVLDLDPNNAAARDALGAAPDDGDTIDLDAVLREMGPEEMAERAARGEQAGERADSDPSFAAMLSQFKAKVTDKVDDSDNAGDHYDLGLAFKEMGLVDEAIAEFQAALTGGTERLKVYEELGQCFMQKNQYNVAVKVLNRALQIEHADESELLGVYYHLGQCHEQLGQRAEAREAYEKVLALDDTFQDVPDRLARL